MAMKVNAFQQKQQPTSEAILSWLDQTFYIQKVNN